MPIYIRQHHSRSKSMKDSGELLARIACFACASMGLVPSLFVANSVLDSGGITCGFPTILVGKYRIVSRLGGGHPSQIYIAAPNGTGY